MSECNENEGYDGNGGDEWSGCREKIIGYQYIQDWWKEVGYTCAKEVN